MIKVAIADDHLIFQKGLSLILDSFDDCELVFKAMNGQELIEKIDHHEVDVILMDLEMPVMNGIEATKHIRSNYPEVKIILLTMHDNEQYINYLVELGVSAYLLKNEEEKELHRAIQTVNKKDFYFNEYVQNAILSRVRKGNKPASPKFSLAKLLTEREKEVINLVCQEMSSKEIGEKLFISSKTVETHRRNIKEKIQVRGTAGLVIFAMLNGIFVPPSPTSNN